MGDEIKTKELSEAEIEKKVLEWEEKIRSKVNSYLDMYLPAAKNGIVGVKYTHPIKAKYETGPVYNEDKAIGVNIAIGFEFLEEFDVPKENPSAN
jgi:hypothetical protein